jgi:LPXTG-site transpeptidase (sortase) family protein
MRKWLGSAILVLALAGCGGQPDAQGPPPDTQVVAASDSPVSQAPPATTDVTALPASPPTEVTIPKIGAKSSLIPLGLNADETIQVPPVERPMQAGWYEKAPTPGEVGPAVILGHVDGHKKPGIFFRLKELAAGDEVLVSRQDGSTARFRVTRVERVSKKDFPTDLVYGDTEGPELRLITCGGVFDHSAKSYKDNIIVFASLVASQS